ncbi:MerR family transcriptional regulator [Saccharibacillus alkalitolerans]|uniref:MerR family transcriptional regulator n=1 Tax=Saccharibacillus alkalitolerans TaxID=2705290 RepID=A0ABX0F611_9BACL|nr:MerR family transcriptional regulator [Saccharibacillus alkalitolerans]NGZ76381.1 MerR family transcriptional regulator [Saccharibacillus alkalitolerans]
MNGETYKVGELARRSGVSVAALHYYEELGLLRPERHPDSGYRLYGPEDLVRLQEIAVLKAMGFKLSQIGDMLPAEAGRSREESWKNALLRQSEWIAARMEELGAMKKLIDSGLFSIEVNRQVVLADMADFVRQLEDFGSARKGAGRAAFFSDEELRRLPQPAETGPEAEVWAALLRRIRANLHRPPESPESLELARELLGYAADAFGGDERLIERYWTFIRPDEGEQARIYGLDEEAFAYIEAITDEYMRRDSGK